MPTTGGVADRWLALRREMPGWQAVFMGLAGISACFALWWFVTRGDPEERIISPSKGLSSPAETFASFPSLWFDRALTRNLLTTLRRLALGFRAGRAGRRAAGRALRLFSPRAGVFPADDLVRSQHPRGRADSR